MLSSLIRKRAEIASYIKHNQAELRKRVVDLDAIDSAICIIDPTADVGEIKNRQYRRLHAAFRGEMMRLVIGTLRVAEAPVTFREIADTFIGGRRLNMGDPKFG